jgi:Mg2+/citrate symporter
MLPVIASGMVCMIVVAYVLGRMERKRLGVIELKQWWTARLNSLFLTLKIPLKKALTVNWTTTVSAASSGMVCMIVVAYVLGRMERKRLGVIELKQPSHTNETARLNSLFLTLKIPLKKALTVNWTTTVSAASIHLNDQRERISAHSSNVLAIGSMIFAAGVFTGILTVIGHQKRKDTAR